LLTEKTTVTSNLETLNVRLPREVVGILDKLVKKGLFSNRSEAVREFCRDYLHNSRRRRINTTKGGRK